MTMRQSRLQGKFSLLIKFRQGQNREISHTGKQIQRGAGWVSRVRKTGKQGQNRQIRQKRDKECWRAWQKHTRQSGREQAEVDQCTCGGTNEGMGCRMQDEARRPHQGPQQAFSALDRLLLTHPVWLQLSLNRDSALYILLREPVGTFLVRKCGFSHKKLLCLRATKERSPASIRELFICEEDSTFSLESSALSFPDLCRLVAFYCISRDVLPFPLQLPEAIARATSHRQLEAISHMGQEFWNAASPSENGSVDQLEESGPSKGQLAPAAGPALDLFGGSQQEKLCFINPLFLQLEQQQQRQPVSSHSSAASTKRHRFKRSMRVRLSADGSMHLSVEGGGSSSVSSSPPRTLERPGGPEVRRPQRKVHTGAGPLRRTPAVSPGSVEDEEPQVGQTKEAAGDPAPQQQDPSMETAVLGLDSCPTPSLAELDSSSSFSSLDEDPDQDSPPPSDDASSSSSSLIQVTAARRPPLMRSRGRGGLQRINAAFVCFFAPEKRVTRLVEELSRDRRSVFGAMVQDFLQRQQEELNRLASSPASPPSAGMSCRSVEVLQGLRLFLSQAKSCLLDSGELEPPIQTLVPESEQERSSSSTGERYEAKSYTKRLQKELTTGPQTLIVGDGAVNKTKHFFSKNTKVLCFTNDMVSDISEKILEITAERPTVKSLDIHTGALDVVKQQSEVLKRDFNDLLNKVQCLNTEVFISGSLPTVRRGDERFSRLLMLNRWLKDTCAAQSVNFIDNFNIFWERRHLFEADGFCLNNCVLRPLKKPLDHALVVLHCLDSSSQRLTQNLLQFKAGAGGGLEQLGIRAPSGAAYDREVERVRQKLGLMQRSHSPIDKVLLLLQACKCVHKATGSLHRQEVSWEDFLLSLTHVIVECNRPHILLEVEYMMELLEPSWLCGEGGYYLSSVYASLCLIQSLAAQQPRPPGCLTRKAQEELREWGRRRGREAQLHRENQRIQYSFHRSTTSRVEVSSAPSPPYTVLMMHCFPLLRCRMVVQNLFEAVRKSFSMASPNSSHQGLLLQFDGIPHRQCPPAGSGIAATAGTDHLAATAPRCVRILFQDGEQSAVRTLQWQAGDSAPALAQLCADAFGVPEPQRYALYWRSGGEMRPLPPNARPQDLASHSEGGPSLSYLRTDHDFSKMRRLTRGGAVDLSESVCEE
ncbi:Ras and Rab interactor 2 [Merluccius polli]|uniref:Ras and Rab interactor 2 n=1 Tax=Merluccius polli TaxID=89951 RepID=A0AA47PCV2_MERPO|nr:Ras and Rab interactor 2 [Merluccius polli]